LTPGALQLVHFLQFLLVVGGLLFAVVGLRLFFLQSRLVFKPSRELIGTPRDFGRPFDDVEMDLPGNWLTKRRVRAHGWWIPGGRSRKAILYFPGAVGNMSCELATLAWLTSLGAQVMTVDYPGFGLSAGRPGEPGCYRAAEAAWRYAVEQRGIAPSDVILFGRSLGAALAARVASRNDCGAIAILSGFTSVPSVAARRYPYLPAYFFCYIRLNTLKYLRGCRCPALVMHSATDRVIPLRHGERLFRAAPSPKRFVPIPGDHYSNEWQAAPEVAEEFASLLYPRVEAWR